MLYSVSIGASEAPAVAVIHGILGSGLNWRSFFQRFLRRRPDLRFVLVDLRNHGRSSHYDHGNTIRSCANDIRALQVDHGPFSAIVGHSFGGKVALQCADLFSESLKEVWALDSHPGRLIDSPSARNEVAEVLVMLRSVPLPVARRQDVMRELMEKGASRAISQWMTTNLQKKADGYVWRFHLDGVEALIGDYFKEDLWSVLEKSTVRCNIVRALRSDRWSDRDIQRLEKLSNGYHCIDAGHWVHSDNPTALMGLLEVELLRPQ